MGNLNAGNGPHAGEEAGDSCQRFDVLVVPEAEIARGDAPLGSDGGRLGEDQTGAADRPAAEVDEVPVVGISVPGKILAHG